MTRDAEWSQEGTRHILRVEPRFQPVVDAAGPYAPERRPAKSLFEVLGRAIVYQQLNGVAAGTIHARYTDLFERRVPEAHQLLRLPLAKLRGAGLSGAKAAALQDLATRIAQNELPSFRQLAALDDDAVVDRLTVVRGVGPWTVHMLLLFHLRRPDVLPTSDYGVRKGYAKLFRKRALPTEAVLTKAAVRWRPYRSIASWYLWRALELEK